MNAMTQSNGLKPSAADLTLASQRVAESIRAMILSGEMAPGSRIRQEELAERFGLSRIPVREALRRLESDGLVLLVPNSSAWVAKIDVPADVNLSSHREWLLFRPQRDWTVNGTTHPAGSLLAAGFELRLDQHDQVSLRFENGRNRR